MPIEGLRLKGWNSWNSGLYLGLEPASAKQLADIMSNGDWLQGLPNEAKLKRGDQLHISLYRERKRGAGTKAVFKQIRAATSRIGAGAVRGVKVILKQLGAPWDEDHMRQLL